MLFSYRFSKTCQLTIVGCYRPPSATSNTLTYLMNSLASLNYKELILMGDFNLNWLLPVSGVSKRFVILIIFFNW